MTEENEDQKVTLKDQQFLLQAAAHRRTPELCVLQLLPFTFWLTLSEHGAIYCLFSRLTKDFCHCFLCHMAAFSANQLILSETFQHLLQVY